jgi:putative tryptophan/tyrosine transport system substrate-binding protein
MFRTRSTPLFALASLLTLLLILAACAAPSAGTVPVIGVMQFSNNDVQDPARDGIVKALNDAGYVDGSTARFIFKNAQGDLPSMQLIAQDMNRQADLMAVVSTQALQAVLAAAKEKPVVFAAVADPKTAGAGSSGQDQLPNVTGAPSTVPMRQALEAVKEALPEAERLGVLYDPSNANSVFYLELLNKEGPALGLEIVPVTVNGSADVLQAANALAAQQIDAFGVITDPSVLASFDSVVKVAETQKIPILTTTPSLVGKGAAVALGWNYFDNGYVGGQLAVRVLKGEKPGSIPYQQPSKTELHVDPAAAQAQGFAIPQAMIDRADRVVGQ